MAPKRDRTPSQQREIDMLEKGKDLHRNANYWRQVRDDLATGVLKPADIVGLPAVWRGVHGASNFVTQAIPLLAADYATKAVTGKDPRMFNKNQDAAQHYYDSIKLDKGYLAHAPTWVKELDKGKDYAMEAVGNSLVPTLGPLGMTRLALSPAYRAAYGSKLLARPLMTKGGLAIGGTLTTMGLGAETLAEGMNSYIQEPQVQEPQVQAQGANDTGVPRLIDDPQFRALYEADPDAAMRLLNTIREPVTGRLPWEPIPQSSTTAAAPAVKLKPSKLHQALTNKLGWTGAGAAVGGLGTYGLMRRFGSKRWAIPAALGGATVGGVLAGALNDHLKRKGII